MQLSIPSHKFLLDENVHRKLYRILKKKGLDVKLAPRASSDTHLATLSKSQNRILVTNDEDFSTYSQHVIYAVILLKIPQGDVDALIDSFERLLENIQTFSGRLIVIEEKKLADFPLAQVK